MNDLSYLKDNIMSRRWKTFFVYLTPLLLKRPKTIYDPTVISNPQMLDWGWEAMDNGVISGRIKEGSASNGLKFRGYIGDDGSVTNFFPIFE